MPFVSYFHHMKRASKISIVFFLLSLFVGLQPCWSQKEVPSFITDSLDQYLQQQQQKWKIPAMAVAIIKDGKVVKQYVNGVTDLKTNTPIDEHSLFMIGSNTKAFTAILTATLATEGAFSLKDPVKKWLPYFELADPYLTTHVDIVDVLSHRVGFETFQGDFLNFDNDLTSEEIIKKFALIQPTHQYRETWGYFNTGYTIAGQIIEKATGQDWATHIQKRIFEPLAMTNSLALSRQMPEATNATKAHTVIDGEVVAIDYGDIDATAPAGSIASSISDMSSWVIMLLGDGNYGDTQVIPAKAIEETIKPRTINGTANDPFRLYGMGWDIVNHHGHKLIMHTGGIHGYVTSVTTVPEENLGVVILTNTDSNYLFEGMKYDIIDPFLNLPQRRLSDVYHNYFTMNTARDKSQLDTYKAQVEKAVAPSLPLSAFEGRYINTVYGYLDIAQDGDALGITFQHHKDLTVRLEHLEADRFLATFSNSLYGTSVFPFTITDGEVAQFTLKLHPQVENTTYDFYKQ